LTPISKQKWSSKKKAISKHVINDQDSDFKDSLYIEYESINKPDINNQTNNLIKIANIMNSNKQKDNQDYNAKLELNVAGINMHPVQNEKRLYDIYINIIKTYN